MCGIAGIVSLTSDRVNRVHASLRVMSQLIAHRGPDDDGVWVSENQKTGFAHRRLSIIDLSIEARQPMVSDNGFVLVFNGEIYNYQELKKEIGNKWNFRTKSDTEVIMAAYEAYGDEFVSKLRGMYAFTLFDKRKNRIICARDRFGIKPFYYTIVNGNFYFASEIKSLLPFLDNIKTDRSSLAEYLTFQYTLGEATLFSNIHQLMPGHFMVIKDGDIKKSRYWDVHYEVDYYHSARFFEDKLIELIDDSVSLHLQSDVPVGSYLSGGIDSSLVSILSSNFDVRNKKAFHGKFVEYPGYDESEYAEAAAKMANKDLLEISITADHFLENIENVIYHLDYPVAGPGSFPQYMVSKLASEHVKVILGGQGGDEIFGGYARYLIAYFEQCINAAIEGTYKNGNFVVTAESIIQNLTILQEYKPLIKLFWGEGLFDSLDKRYFRLVNRSADMVNEVNWDTLDTGAVFNSFSNIFNSKRNVSHEAYFDSMTHFDFKCLLPALLHVEDRMSMAHGLESRVPLLDHPLIEFAATIPADVKFKGGHMKHLLKTAYKDMLPDRILKRRDKMGFPVPLKEWFSGEVGDFVKDIFNSTKTKQREYFNAEVICEEINKSDKFSRKIWGLMSLEIWFQQFHDKEKMYKDMLEDKSVITM